jgi:hypothetical protein
VPSAPEEDEMRTEFVTTDVVFSTGREPRGRGSWAFSLVRYPDPLSKEIFWSPSCTYSEARKLAAKHFPAGSVVWVLS